VFSSPLVRAFRRTYPNIKIVWMAESHTKDLIELHPELDEVIVVDRPGWKRLWGERRLGALGSEMRDLVRDLRKREFDLAIDLQGLLRSGIMTFLSGAPIRVGLGSKEGSGVMMTHVLSRYGGDRRRMSSEYRYLAEELGLDLGDFRMEVPLARRTGAGLRARRRNWDSWAGSLWPFPSRPAPKNIGGRSGGPISLTWSRRTSGGWSGPRANPGDGQVRSHQSGGKNFPHSGQCHG